LDAGKCHSTLRFPFAFWLNNGVERTDYVKYIYEGNRAHLIIEGTYKLITNKNDNVELEYSVPNMPPRKYVGYADIVNLTTNEVFEIKPNSENGIAAGRLEVNEYVTRCNTVCGKNFVKGSNFVDYTIPYPWDWQNKDLVVEKKENGLIVYQIRPLSTPRKLPVPVIPPVPVNVFEKIKEIYGKVIKHPAVQLTPVFVEYIIRTELDKLPKLDKDQVLKYLVYGTVGVLVISYGISLVSAGTLGYQSAVATIFASAIFVVAYDELIGDNSSGGG
jgi:hypothetical protein